MGAIVKHIPTRLGLLAFDAIAKALCGLWLPPEAFDHDTPTCADCRAGVIADGWGIPYLREDRLSSLVPTSVYSSDPVTDSATTLFVWRTAAISKARGCTLAFFCWDAVFQSVLNDPDKYAMLFLQHGIAAVCELDCSMWRGDPVETHVQSVRVARGIGRRWQEAGLLVAPVINWSDEHSYEFAFCDVPRRPPIIVIECRTLRVSTDWPYFLAGLQAAVQHIQPKSIAIYGTWERRRWLTPYLPVGPSYSLLPSWQTARDWQREQEQHRNQPNFFRVGGNEPWADEDQAEAASAVALR